MTGAPTGMENFGPLEAASRKFGAGCPSSVQEAALAMLVWKPDGSNVVVIDKFGSGSGIARRKG